MKKFLIGDMPDPITHELESILLAVETAPFDHITNKGFLTG